jgi:hypothetical protein
MSVLGEDKLKVRRITSGKALLSAIATLVGYSILAGCGGGSSGGGGTVSSPGPTPTPVPQATSVAVSPNSATTSIGATQQFAAQVKGVGSFSTAVTWSVNNVSGGNSSLGTISSSGLYTAPAVVPSGASVAISASSVTTPAVTGFAAENIVSGIAAITVSPTNQVMPVGQSQQFSVTVGGVANQSVIWSITGPPGVSTGTISATGLYTPPSNLANVTDFDITATSVLDANATAFGSIEVFPPPVITGISPNAANVGDIITIQSNNFGPSFLTTIFTGPNNTHVQTAGGGQVVVPHSAVSGPVTVIEQFPGFAPVTMNSVQFTRIPRLRIRANNRDLAVGEFTQMQFRVFGDPTPQTIEWSADIGSVDAAGFYHPGTVLADSFAHVTGCIAATTICDSQILGLHPFRIGPFQPIVPLGGTLPLFAAGGGSTVAATWTQSSGGGSLAANGAYTAGVNLADGGSAGISASFSGTAENASIAVSGAFPGLVQRVNDYIDFNAPIPFGTDDESIAISGNRAFVLADGSFGAFFDKTYFWIDVYDITDPVHPIWIDSVEAASRGQLFASGTLLYQLSGFDTTVGNTFPSVIAAFDVSGPHPVLVSQRIVPSSFFTGFENTTVTAVPGNGQSALPPGTVSVYDLSGGGISENDFLLQVNGAPVSVASATIAQGRLFAILAQNGFPAELGAFDLATNPPAFLGAVAANTSGVMKVVGNTLFVGGDAYDISSVLPVRLGGISGFQASAVNGNLVYATTLQDYARVIDFTTPAQPKLRSVVGEVGVTGGAPAQWVGNHLLLVEGTGGLAVYEAGLPGGLVEQASLPAGGTGSIFTAALDQIATASNLFAATTTDTVGVVNVYDITSVPAVRVGKLETGAQTPVALALAGTTLYVGTDSSLLTVDASNPTSLSQLGSLPVGATTALVRSGTTLYLGTLDNHLLVFDISQPTIPVQGSSILLPSVADRMAISGNLLLVADDVGGLLLFNIATPAHPALLSQLALPGAVGAAGDIAVDGNLVLLAAADAGLLVVDISNPAAPALLGQAKLDLPQFYGGPGTPVLAATIAVHDSIAYVGALQNNATLFGFDYRQPAHPRLASLASYAFGTDDSLLTLRVAGNSLFIGGSLESLNPIFQTDLTQPRNVINTTLLPPVLVPPVTAAAHSLAKATPATLQLRKKKALRLSK